MLALGSNLGDREATIRAAVAALDASARHPRRGRLAALRDARAASRPGVDETAPAYLNAVALVDTALEPHALLARGERRRGRLGRVREERWGDRTIDIDIVDYDGIVSATTTGSPCRIRAPHERAFVLVPWLAVDPDARSLHRPRTASPTSRPPPRDPVHRRLTPGGARVKRTRADAARRARRRRRSSSASSSSSAAAGAGVAVFIPPLTLPITLVVIAVIVVAFAVPIRRARTRGTSTRRIDPFQAMRVVVLAKACSLSGALLTGAASACSLYLLTRVGASRPAPRSLPDGRRHGRRRDPARSPASSPSTSARSRPTTKTTSRRSVHAQAP